MIAILEPSRSRFLPLVLLGWLSIPAGCGPRPQEGEEIVVRRGGDVVGAGAALEVYDSVPGDAMLVGARVEFSGATGGDVLAAGADVKIEGVVDGSVRAAGAAVEIGARVGRNLTAAGAGVEVAEGAEIGGNAYLAGAEVTVRGGVHGLLRVAGARVVLNGPVAGDVRVEAERLQVGPLAEIAGDLRYRADSAEIDPNAAIQGERIVLPPRPERPKGFPLLRVISMVGFLMVGAALILLFPGTSSSAETTLRRRPFPSAGFGLLWLLGVPIAALILFLTVVGIPLGLIVTGLYLASLYVGRAVVAIWAGRFAVRSGEGRGATLARFCVGGLALLVVGLVPIFGVVVTAVATLLGLGAIVGALSAPARAEPV